MPLPVEFDQNEWFQIIVLIVTMSLVLFLPKRFPTSMVILMFLFSSTTARMTDHLLATPPLDLYDINDTAKYDLIDLLTYILYAPFAYLFLYFYKKFNLRGYNTFLYIVIWAVGGTAFEWICHQFNIFNYKGWKINYSFGVYLAIQPITILLYRYIKSVHPAFQENDGGKKVIK